jgi:hypothetical protein
MTAYIYLKSSSREAGYTVTMHWLFACRRVKRGKCGGTRILLKVGGFPIGQED